MDVHQHSHWSETTLENLTEENGNVEYIKISTEAAKGIVRLIEKYYSAICMATFRFVTETTNFLGGCRQVKKPTFESFTGKATNGCIDT